MPEWIILLLPWMLLAGVVLVLALIGKWLLDVRSDLKAIRRILETAEQMKGEVHSRA